MTKDKLKEVIKMYSEWFEKKGGVKTSANKHIIAQYIPTAELLNHCYNMLDRMEEFVDDDVEKAHRWLGFIQGCLWSLGQCSIDDLRRTNYKGD